MSSPTKPHWARQATCVSIGGRAILIEGAPGVGKSSLALGLIDRGAVLVGDDGVMLCEDQDTLYALPHPNTRGLIEVRGVGLVTMPVAERARVALMIRLEAGGPRHIEVAPRITVGSLVIPCITLWPDSSALVLRAELALKYHGLWEPTEI
ncbi:MULTISPECIES: HPr kinase/phosphorylase [unclassified Novosphingobium]|uniref:HPr kinase/phosphorylase n=1 Tax=unclassified Novosphingobium TaxID=2644732 RepID=UPI00086A4326|nr:MULTISPECIES: HPr kinase/phosphatase C-terminal domain-containing protein [unclassified Novosphingobium]MBN9143816.1 HPr kinase/phosphatase C-terminal domain-containing protein [Novosphingobium sp.]MDR6707002.1 hypothetical protein [Novosphingobium sp. 1748]ODU84414.1 MAG: serine kinase [Novosphingobium sp. SCN 63-17]OJX92954.1 MAG: serine kinase [Novosphingobium sp. 63-713]